MTLVGAPPVGGGDDEGRDEDGEGEHGKQEAGDPAPPLRPGTGDRRHLGGDHPRATGRGDHTNALGAGESGEIGELLGLGRRRVGHRPGARHRRRLPHRFDVELLVRCGRIGAVEHVDDDDRHVVAATLTVGGGDELFGGRLGVGDRRHDLLDLVVVDLVGQPVGADDEAVATHDRQRPGVDADGGVDAERPGDDVAAGVRPRLFVGDVPGVDELLHVVVVDGDRGAGARDATDRCASRRC